MGKKFGREWIFRNVSVEIPHGSRYVILGGNGSGKSTLLQIISGFITPNEGKMKIHDSAGEVPEEKIKDCISLASPYLQLIDDYSVSEIFSHVGAYKKFRPGVSRDNIFDLMELADTGNKPVKHFSSGMKQKLRLGLAILAETPILLLDEPVSNLDRQAIRWYQSMLRDYAADRTVIICSNATTEEYEFCDQQLSVSDYKPAAQATGSSH